MIRALTPSFANIPALVPPTLLSLIPPVNGEIARKIIKIYYAFFAY